MYLHHINLQMETPKRTEGHSNRKQWNPGLHPKSAPTASQGSLAQLPRTATEQEWLEILAPPLTGCATWIEFL